MAEGANTPPTAGDGQAPKHDNIIDLDIDRERAQTLGISISNIFSSLQTAMGVWWAAAITTRQTYLEARVALHDAQIEAMRASATTSAVALGRIEESVIGLRADMNRLFEALQERP
jgi:multidrug efflux pump subunit AcrB